MSHDGFCMMPREACYFLTCTCQCHDEDAAVREICRRFVDYVTADGFSAGSMVTRMERLKFETIVTGKSYREVLAEPSSVEDFPD